MAPPLGNPRPGLSLLSISSVPDFSVPEDRRCSMCSAPSPASDHRAGTGPKARFTPRFLYKRTAWTPAWKPYAPRFDPGVANRKRLAAVKISQKRFIITQRSLLPSFVLNSELGDPPTSGAPTSPGLFHPRGRGVAQIGYRALTRHRRSWTQSFTAAASSIAQHRRRLFGPRPERMTRDTASD